MRVPCPSVPSRPLIGSRRSAGSRRPRRQAVNVPGLLFLASPRTEVAEDDATAGLGRTQLRERNNFVPSSPGRSPSAGSPAPGPQEPAAAAACAAPLPSRDQAARRSFLRHAP
ncbi:hypothetical protein GQ55_7G223500 [Panicum hallii var. hallii]|uniref:Uncharacterized protein n=1 Tax=Panicum hallii var. hallii TaxID=1504633 RepID=A0A2T7CXT8_9POAL|nr:hypothetical protein GQ55_7G223500 [Panicum hallii var. hallii]